MKNRIFGATVALIAAANLAFVGGTAGAATSTDYAPQLVYTVADSGINENNNLAIDGLVSFGDKVAFTNSQDSTLWVSDGTTAGTHSLEDDLVALDVTMVEIQRDSGNTYSVDANGSLVFWGFDDVLNTWELFKTDGSTVTQLTDDLDGYGSIYFLDGTIYAHFGEFAAIDPSTGSVVTIENNYDCSAYDGPRDVVELNGKILFTYDDDNCDEQIGVWDPANAAGPSNPLYITPSSGGLGEDSNDGDYLDWDVPSFFVHDGLAYFYAYGNDGSNSIGVEPFVTDGTQAGTELLKDIYVGSDDSRAANTSQLTYTLFNNEIYFYAYDGNDDLLYKTDGTSAGTVEVPMGDFTDPGDNSEGPGTILNGKMIVTFDVSGKGDDWYATDGTSAGTESLLSADLTVSSDGNACWDDCTPAVLFDDHAFFMAYDGEVNAIWVSDGTQAGTEPVTDAAFAVSEYAISDYIEDAPLVVAGDNLYFAVSDWDAEAGVADRSALYKIGPSGLAETGVDASGSMWAGLGLLVAGVAVVATRRRFVK
ncbi:MAG: hypothetical protein RLZZ587_1118 [Actinomycetota bacterium]